MFCLAVCLTVSSTSNGVHYVLPSGVADCRFLVVDYSVLSSGRSDCRVRVGCSVFCLAVCLTAGTRRGMLCVHPSGVFDSRCLVEAALCTA